MFLNNFSGAYRPNWQTPFFGQNTFGGTLGNTLGYGQNAMGTQIPYGQNAFGTQIPYGQNVFGTQIPYGQNAFGTQIPGQNVFGTPINFGQNLLGSQLPYLWNQTPFTSHLGAMPCYYTVGNVMGQFLPQTLGQGINPVNAGFAGVPFANTSLGCYGINNAIGHGFSPVAGFQNSILGC